MPELPEVEIARRSLARWTRGRTIVRAKAESSRLFRGSSAGAFTRRLRGRRIVATDRRGKVLLASLDSGDAVLVHLGMSGKIVRRAPDDAVPAHTRATLELDDGTRLHYTSVRLLGRLLVAKERAIRASPEWASLGPDPLADAFDAGVLAGALAGTHRPVKPALMDQARVAGLGNIQTAEALWHARIDPRTPADRLDPRTIARLARGITRTIADTLAESDGDEIAYLSEGAATPFHVYGREGEPCPRCGAPIERIVQGGRATFFCPACQRLVRTPTRETAARPRSRRGPRGA